MRHTIPLGFLLCACGSDEPPPPADFPDAPHADLSGVYADTPLYEAAPDAAAPDSVAPPEALSATRGIPGGCDPNYDPCVPVERDVDCAGGGGNGPSYVRGPVRVIGRDVYGLDRNDDGIACEN